LASKINNRNDPGASAPQKTPLPWREGIKGRGLKMMIMHPHPSPLPSRERGNWI